MARHVERLFDVDVAVVGAGPAGLAVARHTASAGLDTLVIERQNEVGEHVRTSGATAVSTVTRLETPQHLYHPFGRFRISSPGETAVFETASSLCVLDVRGFYRWLAAEATASGARVSTGTTAKEAIVDDGVVSGCEIVTRD